MKSMLEVRRITKRFGRDTVLDDVGFTAKPGEFVCLLGPSGCGKTTLLRIVAGLEQPQSGEVFIGGRDVVDLPPARRGLGIVFQSYALFPNLTAAQNVAYGLKGKTKRAERERIVAESLSLVGLEEYGGRYPAKLSGGQQQRVALARALALSPSLLLLDEPLSALDAKVRLRLRTQIRQLQRKLGLTTVMVTHDQEEALTMADTVVVMSTARIEQIGTPQDVYHAPATPFVADFIGAVNFIDDAMAHSFERSAEGMLAIRPEHVRLLEDSEPGGVEAFIRDVEFRGPYYRLFLETATGGGTQLLAMLPSGKTGNGGPERGKRIRVDLPRERLITYPRTGDESSQATGQTPMIA